MAQSGPITPHGSRTRAAGAQPQLATWKARQKAPRYAPAKELKFPENIYAVICQTYQHSASTRRLLHSKWRVGLPGPPDGVGAHGRSG